ncbi:MAG: YfhO family protein [Candidatus Blackburnbacteria bacterium]|nr:YfhO family protein [Candidatus Blackburnbacteria bacterium]
MAAFGADCFLETGKLRLRTLLPAFSILIVFSVISVYFYLNPPSVIDPTNNNLFGAERADYRVGLRNLVLPILAFFSSLLVFKVTGGVNRVRQLSLVLVFLIMLTELYWFWAKFTPFSPRRIVFPKTPVLEFLEKQEKPFRTTGYKVIPINMRMPYKIETLEGYDAIYPLSLSQFVAAITSGKSGTQPVGRYATIGDETVKALDLVNVKYVIAVKRDERSRPSPEGKIASSLENPKLQLAYEDKSVVVLESRNVLPRAFVVYSWERSLGNKTLDRFLDPDFPISEKVFLEEELGFVNKAAGKGESSVLYEKYSDQESMFKVRTSKDGLLFVSDTYYPGWKAYVDDVETKIYKANFAFRAIAVPAGEHVVKMTYKPDSFFNGLRLSAISLTFLLLGGVTKVLIGRKHGKAYT